MDIKKKLHIRRPSKEYDRIDCYLYQMS